MRKNLVQLPDRLNASGDVIKQPLHLLPLDRPFALRQWRACMRTNPTTMVRLLAMR